MSRETMYGIVQFIRTLLPVFAGIGTVSSVVGFWRMFRKWDKPGYLSLLPFARGYIFGKDSNMIPRLIYALSDGMILVMTPIFYYIRIYGKVEEVMIGNHVFFIDRAMIIITVFWAIFEVARFFSSVHVSTSLCRKNHRGKGWIVSWILMPKISKIVWGFSNRVMTDERKSELKS